VDVVLLDGRYGVNIITKDLRNKLRLLILRSIAYNLVMVYQNLAKLIGLFKNLNFHIHGISYYRNLSFGLMTKARVYKVAGQEGNQESHKILPGV
jgi:hypothetical protein